MRRLEAQLDETEGVEPVWFNAWAGERGDVLEGLIKSVLDELDPNILRKAAKNRKLMTGLRIAVTMVAGWLRVGNIVDELWERASVDAKTRNELRDLLVDAMNEWTEKGATSTHGRLLVVFVDDLDRCSPDAVFQAFEAIKLYLDAPGFVFVIGFDKTIVSEAVLEQKRYSKSVKGADNIEKIIQIQYRLPEPTPDQINTLVDGYARDSRTNDLLDKEARELIVSENARNPRRLKRFLNVFVLEQQLEPDAAELSSETLIRTLILELYFGDFIGLYRGRSEDAIGEFVTYLDLRSASLGQTELRPDLKKFVQDSGANPEREGFLAELEQNFFPERFPELARNASFVKLVRDLNAAPDRAEVRTKLAKASARPRPEVAEPEPRRADDTNLTGLRILWLDDKPQGNTIVVEACERAGASVRQFAWPRDAVGFDFDVLVSDIARGAESAAEVGFTFPAELGVSDRGADVVFYTTRVTPTRRRRAAEMGAEITNDPKELLEILGRIAARRRATAAAPPS